MSETGVDYPDVKTVVDVFTDSHDQPLTSVVEEADDAELVVAVGQDGSGTRVRLDVGEKLQLVWRGPHTLHEIPVELLGVRAGAEPSWRLRVLGPATTVQRRDAVRAPMRLQVVADRGGEPQPGWTVDLSEGGLRCLFTTVPEDPELPGGRSAVGDRLQLAVDLDGEYQVTDEVQVVRVHTRTDGFWEASLRFTEVSERDKDVIRKKVFGVLRKLRAEGHL